MPIEIWIWCPDKAAAIVDNQAAMEKIPLNYCPLGFLVVEIEAKLIKGLN